MLDLQSAEYVLDQGHPELRLVIDGKSALVVEPNRSLLEAGFVYLVSFRAGERWEELLPPITLPVIPGLFDEPMTVEGVTDDPRIVRLVRDFVEALDQPGAFQPGPLPLPRA